VDPGVPGQQPREFIGALLQLLRIGRRGRRALRRVLRDGFEHLDKGVLWHQESAIACSLQFEQLGITSAHAREFLVRAFFGDVSVLKYYDAVSHAYR